MSALSEALNRANTRGLSSRAIATEAEKRGHRINFSTASKYLNGTHGDPEENTLQALAAALQVPLDMLREAAGLPRDEGPFQLPAAAARLTRRQREAVLSVVGAFLESDVETEVGGEHDRSAPRNRAGVSPASEGHVDDEEGLGRADEPAHDVEGLGLADESAGGNGHRE